MKRNDEIMLVGHLQVVDEPLSSLYADKANGLYFLFVRTFDETDEQTYVLSEVKPSVVLSYMEGYIGLKHIFGSSKTYSYIHKEKYLDRSQFKPISHNTAYGMLDEDGLEDMFDSRFAHKSVMLKRHLREIMNFA